MLIMVATAALTAAITDVTSDVDSTYDRNVLEAGERRTIE